MNKSNVAKNYINLSSTEHGKRRFALSLTQNDQRIRYRTSVVSSHFDGFYQIHISGTILNTGTNYTHLCHVLYGILCRVE